MKKLYAVLFLAALTSACASNDKMQESGTMMKDEGMHKSMEMKKDGAMDSMSHDSMKKDAM